MASLDEEDFSSDTDDDDYVPIDEGGSEEEESGDEEAPLDTESDPNLKPRRDASKKRKKKQEDTFTRKRQGGIKLEEEETEKTEVVEKDTYNEELGQKIVEEGEKKKEDMEKKKVDDLWASFKADVGGPKPKAKPAAKSTGFGSFSSVVKTVSSPASTSKTSNIFGTSKASESKSDKLTITKEFDFAGEVVKVTKEVDITSKEAKQELKKQEESKTTPTGYAGPSVPSNKRPGGGLGGVLGIIGKKPKMGTLDKSKLDWEKFKEKEGIQEDLQTHNKGKEGYIERQAFLNRADVRQFEIERNIRLGLSGKR